MRKVHPLYFISKQFRNRPDKDMCQECQAHLPIPELKRQHLVEVHGYQREGDQVFKRLTCNYYVDGEACGGPALQTFGVFMACKKHVEELKRLRLETMVPAYERRAGALEAQLNDRDRELRRVDGLHKMMIDRMHRTRTRRGK